MSAPYLRLRQVCLAAPRLEPVVDAVRAIFGVEVCHRDDAVGAYGLENALFVFGHAFLEVVAPTRAGTAVDRFLARSAGRGGYMAIFDCHDPERRRERAQAMGVRIAHALDRPGAFWGSQLHPRDGRATMLEFDRSVGGDALDGAYWPAGPHWRRFQRLDRVAGIPWITLESPDADALAAHWSRLMDVGITHDEQGHSALRFDLGAARFAAPSAGVTECLAGIDVAVPDPGATLAAAARQRCAIDGDGFWLAGVRCRPTAL